MIELKTIDIVKETARQTDISERSIEAVLELVKDGGTIPFIARYRKEKTNGLDEVQIASVIDISQKIETLEKRKVAVLKSLEETGNYNDDLGRLIDEADDLKTVEEIYAPFKPGRKTKADKAIEAGLGPFAEMIILENPDTEQIFKNAADHICEAFPSEETVVSGAQDIITQKIADDLNVRSFFRNKLKNGSVVSKVKRGKKEKGVVYSDYFDFIEPVSKIVPHRIMALNRGEKEGFLNVSIVPGRSVEELSSQVTDIFFGRKGEFFLKCGIESVEKMLLKSLGNEIFEDLKEKAIESSLNIFHKNLEQIISAPPFGEKPVVAVDPGIRTGCKTVALDSFGNYIESTVLNLHDNRNDALRLKDWIERYSIKGIAVGNGTFGRESFDILRGFYGKEIAVTPVNEDGASIYSASEIARKEFPNLDLTVRGAISIGRRFQDPMAELVKIPPESLGVGQYQHDIPVKQLSENLKRTVEWVVNRVGANLNTAGHHLLAYISGLDIKKADEISKYRKENGRFGNLDELKKVKGIGAKSFEQCAGFLRIFDGTQPLDATGVHPESYGDVKKAAKKWNTPVKELIKNPALIDTFPDAINVLSASVIDELKKRGLDPREQYESAEFSDNVRNINDLEQGMILNGVVDNIVAFGAFVDIGIKEKGLVHISEISNEFISSVSDRLSLGQIVKVLVKDIDKERKRISLSMKF